MILSIRSEFYQIGTLHYSLEGVVALLTTVFRVVLSLDEGVSKTHKQNITLVAFNFSEMLLDKLLHVATYATSCTCLDDSYQEVIKIIT